MSAEQTVVESRGHGHGIASVHDQMAIDGARVADFGNWQNSPDSNYFGHRQVNRRNPNTSSQRINPVQSTNCRMAPTPQPQDRSSIANTPYCALRTPQMIAICRSVRPHSGSCTVMRSPSPPLVGIPKGAKP